MRSQLLCLAALAALASCGPPPARPVSVSPTAGALPPGPTRDLISNEGQKVPCTVQGGGMCVQE